MIDKIDLLIKSAGRVPAKKNIIASTTMSLPSMDDAPIYAGISKPQGKIPVINPSPAGNKGEWVILDDILILLPIV